MGRPFRVTKGPVPGRLFWALPGAPARQLPPGNGQLQSGHKRPFSPKESVGQKTRTTGPFPAVEGKERALAVSCQEPTTGKTMATGIPGEGPWPRLNPETGTAPEKGQSRTSRAGANTSRYPVIPGVKAPPVELPAFFRISIDIQIIFKKHDKKLLCITDQTRLRI